MCVIWDNTSRTEDLHYYDRLPFSILVRGGAMTDRTMCYGGEETGAAISADDGAAWSEYQAIGYGHPVMMTDQGEGTLSCCGGELIRWRP